MITKVTLTYSDGSTHDFLSIDDAVQMAASPELHPDAPETAPALPEEAPVPEVAPEVTPEVATNHAEDLPPAPEPEV